FAPGLTALVTFPAGKDDKVIVRNLPAGDDRGPLNLRLPEQRLWTVAPGAAWFALVEPKPNNKRVRVLDGKTEEEQFTREFDEIVNCVCASPDRKILAVGLTDAGRGLNSKVLLLDAATSDRLGAL